MFRRLIKSKVFWVSVGGVFVAIGTMVAGEISVTAGILIIFESLLAMFFRDTLAKIN